MTTSVPTPIPPRPSFNLEHWIWLDPHRPLDKSPIAQDSRASALASAIPELRLIALRLVDDANFRRIVRRFDRDPGPCVFAELSGPRLGVADIQNRLDPFLWNVEKHGWHCRVAALDPDAGRLCLMPRPDTIQPSLAIAASTRRQWPEFHGLTLSVFPSGITKGHRLKIAPPSAALH